MESCAERGKAISAWLSKNYFLVRVVVGMMDVMYLFLHDICDNPHAGHSILKDLGICLRKGGRIQIGECEDMNMLSVVLAIIAALAILCQWFVFVSVRTYLFEKYAPVGRTTAYPVLMLLGILNFAVVLLAFSSDWLLPDSYQRKVITVLFFSYLGFVLTMSLFFVALGAFSRTLNLKDRMVAGIRKGMDRWKSKARVVPGHASRETRIEAEAATPSQSESSIMVAAKRSDLESQQNMKIHPRSGKSTPLRRKADRGDFQIESQGKETPTTLQSSAENESDRALLAPTPTRRAFLKWSTAAGLVGVAGYAGHGVAQAYQDPVVDKSRVALPQLTGISQPLTVIQITDLHFGLFVGTPELMRLIDQANSVEGDAVLITGDVFHSRMSPVEPAIPLLKKLKPRRLGNFVILGNHDFYAGEHRTVDALLEAGLTLLRDQWVTFDHHNVAIHLGGIDDPRGNWIWSKEFPGFQSFVDKAPTESGVRILLSHRPNVLPLASQANIDLVLAGHTHGGQVILPTGNHKRGISLARLASLYTHGWYRQGSTRMYLNRGVGLTFVPWRINCPPEIAVVQLVGIAAA